MRSFSPTAPACTSSTGSPNNGGQAVGIGQSSTTGTTCTVQVPNGTSAVAAPALVGPEAVKALKGQLERLTAAKAATAMDPLLGHVTAGLEHQIQAVRNQLAAAQPLEVALRGTLSAVSAARQTLSKAEQKAAKLEAQVVAAVSAYDAAAAEVQAAQKALSEAEAATARTAGGRFDPKLLIGSHPGAALAVLSEAAAARCIVGSAGVDAVLAARVREAFEEVQRVCRLLPADVPPPKPAAAAAGGDTGPPTSTDGAAVALEVQMGEAVSGGITGPPQGTAPHADSSAASTSQLQQQLPQQQLQQPQAVFSSAEDAIAWAAQQQQQQQQALAQQQAAQLQAQAAAAELAQQHAQAVLAQATQLAAAIPAGVAFVGPASLAAVQATSAGTDGQGTPSSPSDQIGQLPHGQGAAVSDHVAAVPPTPRGDAGLSVGKSGGESHDGGRTGDDNMGGGASDTVANKRSAAEAVETARGLAAKAKARAC